MLQLQRIITRNHIYIAIFVCLSIFLYSLWFQVIPPEKFEQVNNLPSGTFKYGGSTSWNTIPEQVELSIKKISQSKEQKFQLGQYISIGSDNGINKLLNNELDFSLSSRQLKDDELKRGLKQIPVGIDGLAIIVNLDLKIDGLDVEQLKDIYTGKITNWNEINPQINLPIKPLSRTQQASGTVNFFKMVVLETEEFAKEVEFVNSTTDALIKMEYNLYKGSIYYATASEVVNQCNSKPLRLRGKSGKLVEPYAPPAFPKPECPLKPTGVNTTVFQSGEYPITRKLFVIINTKQPDKRKQKAGKAYARFLLTNQGQQLVEEASFVRIK